MAKKLNPINNINENANSRYQKIEEEYGIDYNEMEQNGNKIKQTINRKKRQKFYEYNGTVKYGEWESTGEKDEKEIEVKTNNNSNNYSLKKINEDFLEIIKNGKEITSNYKDYKKAYELCKVNKKMNFIKSYNLVRTEPDKADEILEDYRENQKRERLKEKYNEKIRYLTKHNNSLGCEDSDDNDLEKVRDNKTNNGICIII